MEIMIALNFYDTRRWDIKITNIKKERKKVKEKERK